MDWRAKVDLFEQLRREHEFGVGTVAGVAAKFGVHRRMVRQALASALPPSRHYSPRAKPKLDLVASIIDRVLEDDMRAPRKQRHTARRLYRRLLNLYPAECEQVLCHRTHLAVELRVGQRLVAAHQRLVRGRPQRCVGQPISVRSLAASTALWASLLSTFGS